LKKELVNLLVCPLCKGDLGLKVDEEEGDEIISGSFTCSACQQSYPIKEGIPNLLPPELRTKP
jgi:uncharacterized protein YbaR (Trm112 family)